MPQAPERLRTMHASLSLRASRALLPGAAVATSTATLGAAVPAASQSGRNAIARGSGVRAASARVAREIASRAAPEAQVARSSVRNTFCAHPLRGASGAAQGTRAGGRNFASQSLRAAGAHGGGAQGSTTGMALGAAGVLSGALVWSSRQTADMDAAGAMTERSVGLALASKDSAEARRGAEGAKGIDAAAAGGCHLPHPQRPAALPHPVCPRGDAPRCCWPCRAAPRAPHMPRAAAQCGYWRSVRCSSISTQRSARQP